MTRANDLALGVVVSGKPAYIILGFAGLGVFVTAKTGIRAYKEIRQRIEGMSSWQDDAATTD